MTMIATSYLAPTHARAGDWTGRRRRRIVADWPMDARGAFNLVEHADGRYRLTVDVAGFAADDLTVEQHPQALVITGASAGNPPRGPGRTLFRHALRRVFPLPDEARVTGAALANGLLAIAFDIAARHAGRPIRVPISNAGADGAPTGLAARAKAFLRRLAARWS